MLLNLKEYREISYKALKAASNIIDLTTCHLKTINHKWRMIKSKNWTKLGSHTQLYQFITSHCRT